MGCRFSPSRAKIALVTAAALAMGSFGLVAATPAIAAVSLTVSTTADIAANAGDCGSSSTTVPSPLSLREATCIANNYGNSQPVTIVVPAGTYTLANGELQLGKTGGANITVNGAGSSSTIIDGNHAGRVFDLDPSLVGGVAVSISGVTVTNGRDGTFGGAGIIAGSGNAATLDTLTLSNAAITNNQANFAVPTASNKPGGGLLFQGGSLTLSNVAVSGNQSFSSPGAGVFYEAVGATGGQSLTITGGSFAGNSTANSGASGLAGGALGLGAGAGGASDTVSNTVFSGNTSTSTSSEQAVGGAIFLEGGDLTVTGSTFTNNAVTGSGALGGPILYTAGNATLRYDRFVGNTGTGGIMTNNGSGSVTATEDWWGCNTGANSAGCETTAGTGIVSQPRLVLAATASPSHVIGPNGTATLTASLLTDSTGNPVSATNLTSAFDGLPVSFADPPGDATVTLTAGAHSASLANGVASIDYHSNTTLGPDNDAVTLDNGTVASVVEVDEAPTITSANSTHLTAGAAGSYTITTTGYPSAAITENGALPTGLIFHDNGDGSATISGTPAPETGGTYSLNLTATNGIAPTATQTLTVDVGQPPAFTSPATATFVIGSAGSFTATTSGVPNVSAITESGTLPAGVTFTDNGNGTATIAGTPTGTGNTYPLTLTATNGVSPDATQAVTIQVNRAPSVTLNPVDQTVPPGTSVTFTAAASGVPTPSVQWQRSTDGGASFTPITGASSTSYTFTTAGGDDGSQYRAVFSNGVGSPATTTAATLHVGLAPSFTSADTTSFVIGSAGSFALTTTGVPSATLSRTGVQFPAWLTLTDNGDGTGTLTGTPPAGSAGTYQFTLQAANGFTAPAAQTFTLFVDQSPTITSADHGTFTTGQPGNVAVTSTAGFPTSTAITKTGSLPAGVSFHDNGDGTATLAGTPAAGTGGTYPITITATAVGGIAAPATQSFTLTVLAPPIITSADHTAIAAGSAGSFTITTTAGFPAATTLTESGSLPAGVTFTDNGDGTASVTGTPTPGTGGSYPLTITAGNGVLPDSTQTFTLTVTELPTIRSADHATFTVGTAGSFDVTTTAGFPTATTLTETGSLPSGLTFTDNGDGTGTLAGAPDAGAGGTFPLTVTATNSVGHTDQAFTLTVTESPAITSANTTPFTVGSAGSFVVTTADGFPTPPSLHVSPGLPDGITFVDNGDGTATISGTPQPGQGGTYPVTITATNGMTADGAQRFTLVIGEAPVITSADAATLTIARAGSFTVRTTGFEQPTLTESGALPGAVSFTDNGNGTATVTGTPAAGTAGTYPLTLHATNNAGTVDQAFTLTVVRAPQTITVTSTPPSPAYVGGSYLLAAGSDSGLAVAYSIDATTPNSACTLSGSTVSFDSAGSCVVDFDQPGDDTFAPATRVQQSIAVSTVGTTVSVTTAPSSSVYGQDVHATAAVAADRGAPSGTVQFSVYGVAFGSPVAVVGGDAVSAALTSPGGAPLTPGGHHIGAVFTPDDAVTYASATGSVELAVGQAATTTTLAVHAHDLAAVVAAAAPGSGIPTGTVGFSVGGRPVGTAPLVGGVARLSYTVPAGRANMVAATYSGGPDFTASSVSTTRRDPVITAHLTSLSPKSRYGWYRSSVAVSFTCTPAGAPLTTPCPAAVVLRHEGAGQSVTRTISATDGGTTTIAVRGIDIDTTRPAVTITGPRNGATYSGAAPAARCLATDRLSGVASCTLSRSVRGDRTTYRATAADRAGNTSTTSVTFTVLAYYLTGAAYQAGAFTVRVGHVYTLVVTGTGSRPVFYDAAVHPLRPTKRDNAFRNAGYHRWTLGVYMQPSLRTHKYWNLGVKVGATLHIIEIRIA